MDTNKTFIFFLKKRKPLLMIFLLKYLKFSDLYKLKIVCKQNKLDHLSIINWFAETKNKLTYDLLIILAYNLFILF